MFVRSVFEGIRSGVCEFVHRKRLQILREERKSLLKKVPGTFSLPARVLCTWSGKDACHMEIGRIRAFQCIGF